MEFSETEAALDYVSGHDPLVVNRGFTFFTNLQLSDLISLILK